MCTAIGLLPGDVGREGRTGPPLLLQVLSAPSAVTAASDAMRSWRHVGRLNDAFDEAQQRAFTPCTSVALKRNGGQFWLPSGDLLIWRVAAH
jgi:hypothetical protein